jgi:uncharacterized protein
VRTVFDTNVYLAAIREGYAWEQLTRSGPNGPYQVFISPEIILEIRGKLEGRFEWSRSASAEFIEKVFLYAKLVHPRQRVRDVLKDTDDHIILECALEAKAAAIVTADRELLRLKRFRDIAIVHPTMLQYLTQQP